MMEDLFDGAPDPYVDKMIKRIKGILYSRGEAFILRVETSGLMPAQVLLFSLGHRKRRGSFT
jgi:hypothetical protein